MFFHMVYKSGPIFLPFCHNSRMCRTEGRTDGRTEFSSLDRVCITCSAVKTKLRNQTRHTLYWKFKKAIDNKRFVEARAIIIPN